MNSLCQNKIYRHLLNLDYDVYAGLNLDNQTNFLINSTIRNFIKTIESLDSNTIFVYEYRDDVLSLIGLRILKAAQQFTKFNFVLYGIKKKTKAAIKKEKFISSWKLKRNRDNIFYISSFNSIYKVTEENKKFKKFGLDKIGRVDFKLLEKFTLSEIKKAVEFYDLTNSGGPIIIGQEAKIYDKWCQNPVSIAPPEQCFEHIGITDWPKVTCIWLTGNIEADKEFLDYCVDTDDIVFYYSPNKEDIKIFHDFNYYLAVRRKSNFPCQKNMNINPDRKFIDEIKGQKPINLIGKWPVNEYNEFCRIRIGE